MQEGIEDPSSSSTVSSAAPLRQTVDAPSITRLWIEWLILFIGFPMLAYLEWLPVSKFLVFALPVVYGALVYWRSPDELKVQARDKGSHNLLIVRLTRAAVIAFSIPELSMRCARGCCRSPI